MLEDRGTSIYLYPLCANLLERTDWGGILWEQLLTSLLQYVPHILKSPEVSKLTDCWRVILPWKVAGDCVSVLPIPLSNVNAIVNMHTRISQPRDLQYLVARLPRAIALLYGKNIKPKWVGGRTPINRFWQNSQERSEMIQGTIDSILVVLPSWSEIFGGHDYTVLRSLRFLFIDALKRAQTIIYITNYNMVPL